MTPITTKGSTSNNMKKILYPILCIMLIGCNGELTEKDMDEFDMSQYCESYFVITIPGNKTCYIFIDKKDIKSRFVIYKDYNYKDSGYGFAYNNRLDAPAALEHGLFKTADEAIERASNNLDYYMQLQNIILVDDNEWRLMDGRRAFGLCNNK